MSTDVRPRILNQPSASRVTVSPVRNQPSVNAAAVASSRRQ
jgi:hypothetical protein